MTRSRRLIIVADDYGIGPSTSRGILELGQEGRITGTALLVNSPSAESAVRMWQHSRRPLELGWHANLTLDRPLLAPERVPSLVAPNGRFWPLRDFFSRWLVGKLRRDEIFAELAAQWRRFVELVGQPPALVNSHHHVAVFPPVGQSLLSIMSQQATRPFFRNECESVRSFVRTRGGRVKRLLVSLLGQRLAGQARSRGYIGCDGLAGIHGSRDRLSEAFFGDCLAGATGSSVELMCHPGYHDATLVGRDECVSDMSLARRESELKWLRDRRLDECLRENGYELTCPSQLTGPSRRAA